LQTPTPLDRLLVSIRDFKSPTVAVREARSRPSPKKGRTDAARCRPGIVRDTVLTVLVEQGVPMRPRQVYPHVYRYLDGAVSLSGVKNALQAGVSGRSPTLYRRPSDTTRRGMTRLAMLLIAPCVVSAISTTRSIGPSERRDPALAGMASRLRRTGGVAGAIGPNAPRLAFVVPLYRVHECAFGVLTMESEPVDPACDKARGP
jgi:hypothetical protein